MSFDQVFKFLRELEVNNSKEWMDKHRNEYEAVKHYVIDWTNELSEELTKVDDEFRPPEGNKAITRINNNLVYHPNKPIYKTYFGIRLKISGGRSSFYTQISLSNNLVGGGVYKPDKETLDKVREAIDYDGDRLKKILNKPSFKKTFGQLDTKHQLKTAPKGYSKDHEHINLLRLRSFTVFHPTTEQQITSDDFMKQVVKLYKEMMPFGRYFNQAVTV